MRLFVKQLFHGLRDIIYPDVCMLCATPLYGINHYVCDDCLFQEVMLGDQYNTYIQSLIPYPRPVTFQWSCWHFTKRNRIQQLMHELKYGGKAGIGTDMGHFAAKQAKVDPNFRVEELADPLLLPVPLHPRKERIRGYNQAKSIAEGISKVLNLPVVEDTTVVRTRFTTTQTGLSAKQRQNNMASVFYVNSASTISARDIIIVDDVFTTGATTIELAKCLFKAGARNIGIMTLALA